MAIETTVIVDKLKEEGINEALSNGLSFETEDDLTSWVDNYKSGLPTVKKLEDYTKDEIEELAKDPQFKGAKGLQGFVDSIRQKQVKKPETKPNVKPDEKEPEWAKKIREQQEKILAKNEQEEFNSTVSKLAKAEKLNDVHIARVKKSLSPTATEAEIKAEIESYKKEMSELGIKEFGTPGGGGKNNSSSGEKLAKAWAEKHKKKIKK